MGEVMQIGRVARTTGLTVETIRYYERVGLLPSPRRKETVYGAPGYRVYSQEHLRVLEFIKRARALDLSLNQIKEILDAVRDGCCGSARPSLAAMVAEKLREVDARVRMLETLRAELADIQARLAESAARPQQECDCPSTSDVGSCVFVEEPQLGWERR